MGAPCDAVEQDREVLIGDLLRAEVPAGPVPADRHPDRVPDEAVGQVGVEVGAQLAAAHAFGEQLGPHLLEADVVIVQVAEPLELHQVRRVVLEDRHLVVVVVDRVE